ncbi:Regulator of RpoS [anaerobic digester metagenome]
MALNSKRILLVDDDEISRLVAFEVLTHLGATVDLAEAPEDAMRLIGSHRYDLIMLDLFMPTLNGIELAGIMIALDGSLAERIAILTAGRPDGTKPTPVTRFRVFHKPLRADDVLEFLTGTTSSDAIYSYDAPAESLEYPDIDGIDIPAGIRNFMGQELSFFSTLRAFPEYSRKFLEDFRLSLSAANAKECRRLAHSLKGSSAMIGALDIHVLAKELEASSGRNADPARNTDLFQRLETLILRANQSIDACIKRQHRLFQEP